MGLRDKLRSQAELSEAQVDKGKELPDGSGTQGCEFGYRAGEYQGKVVVKVEQPPENAHILDGREATHQLTVEIIEAFQAKR